MTETVRFGSWNLFNGGIDGVNGRDESRRHSQIEILAALQCDVLALQELTGWEAEDWRRLFELANALKMVPLPPVTSHIGNGRNHLALLYRPEKVRVVGYRPDLGKGALHHGLARARLAVESEEFLAFATHLAWSEGETRLKETRWVTDYGGVFPGCPQAAVCLGDLNVPSNQDPEPDWNLVPRNLHSRYRLMRADGSFGDVDRRALRVLLNSGWIDPQTLVSEARAATVGYWYANEPVPLHLDHILTTRQIKVRAYRTHDTAQARAASDHLPIYLDAELGEVRQ
ncbi:endonuclease/exonuclease/phosphatase family protein [Streptomyces sp. x-80]|uniref:endonuclease/exonuclease/phosphatase family protein n=1 Tax=Streptomyces sp. x-80 TaxID=2789282 RepID=UPI00397E969F